MSNTSIQQMAGRADSGRAQAQPALSKLLLRSDRSGDSVSRIPGNCCFLAALSVTHFVASLLRATFAETSKTSFTRRRSKPVGTPLPFHSPSERWTNSRHDRSGRIREVTRVLSLQA